MSAPRLHPSSRIESADWIKARLRNFGSSVAAIVPDGFPAYVRILHPVEGLNREPLRWADIAAWSGRTMHPLVQFHAIARPLSGATDRPSPWNGAEPSTGNLAPELLRALSATLAMHTHTPDSCWFCLWIGYGWLHGSAGVGLLGRDDSPAFKPAWLPDVMYGSQVQLPGREYLLLEGPLEAATDLGDTSGGWLDPQSPNLFWPDDHAWCVASEIDLYCTLVAGSEALASALVADSRLEAWRVEPGDPVSYDSDFVNT